MVWGFWIFLKTLYFIKSRPFCSFGSFLFFLLTWSLFHFVYSKFILHKLHNLSHVQGRHGEFEPGKVQYSTPNFFDRLFLIRAYWNPNLGKAQALGALPAVAPLHLEHCVHNCNQPNDEMHQGLWLSIKFGFPQTGKGSPNFFEIGWQTPEIH